MGYIILGFGTIQLYYNWFALPMVIIVLAEVIYGLSDGLNGGFS
jgi:hypothetical protein